MDPRIQAAGKMAQAGARIAQRYGPSAKNFGLEAIKMAAKKAPKGGIWGISKKMIEELAKKGIKVNEYWRSGPNPGQR